MTAEGSDISRAVDRYLRSSGDSDQYRHTADTVLEQFTVWLRRRELETFDSFESDGEQILRRYADRLNQRVEANGITVSTAQMYYNVVSGFLGYCVRDGVLSQNPALTDRAREPLPRDDEDRTQQFWTPAVRQKLVEYTNECATKQSKQTVSMQRRPPRTARSSTFSRTRASEGRRSSV